MGSVTAAMGDGDNGRQQRGTGNGNIEGWGMVTGHVDWWQRRAAAMGGSNYCGSDGCQQIVRVAGTGFKKHPCLDDADMRWVSCVLSPIK